MARVLITGMSDAGKTTLLDEMRRRGHLTVDTDYDGWVLPDGTWDDDRMNRLLATHAEIVVSGTAGLSVQKVPETTEARSPSRGPGLGAFRFGYWRR